MAAPKAARAEAAAWLARLHGDARSAADEVAFQRWLRADPAHEAAFTAVTAAWDAVGGLKHEHLTRSDAGARREAGLPSSGQMRLLERRGVLAGAGALVLAGAGIGTWRQAHAGVYETALGELRRISLEDGSELLLDTETRVRVRFDDQVRGVQLSRGCVHCQIAADPVRPFLIQAADRQVLALNSIVDVRSDVGGLQVLCLDGQATVSDAAMRSGNGGRLLRAGERLRAAPARAGLVDRPDLVPLTAWQSGRAVFKDVTLPQAVDEMNRYSRVKLRVADARLAPLRLSGVYQTGDNQAFAKSVAALLPVAVRRANRNEVELVGDAQRMNLSD
jgi:transmembrane sensor